MAFVRKVFVLGLLAALVAPVRASGTHTRGQLPAEHLEIKVGSERIFAGTRVHVEFPSGTAIRSALIGPGSLDGAQYVAPENVAAPTEVTILAATPAGSTSRTITVVPRPRERTAYVAVATYDSGIALHRLDTMALVGIIPIEQGAADIDYDARNDALYAPLAQGSALVRVALADLSVTQIDGVILGNEVRVDPRTSAVLVSNRDVDGDGALTKVADGHVGRVITGKTAEGIAIDDARGVAYVTNVNDDTVAEIDLATLRRIRAFPAGAKRPFGIAYDPRTRRIYVASNEPSTPGQPRSMGSVVAIDLLPSPHVIARAGGLALPLGVAFDARTNRLFVTDEGSDRLEILDGTTLRERRAALATCSIPWRPTLDAQRRRLYVPCARSNAVAVYDADSLQPIHGSPFHTGGYPLGVALVTYSSGTPGLR